MFKAGDFVDSLGRRWVVLDCLQSNLICLSIEPFLEKPFNYDERKFKDHLTSWELSRPAVSNRYEGCDIQKYLQELDPRLSLLTLEQYQRYKSVIPLYPGNWWLKDSSRQFSVFSVDSHGEVYECEACSYLVGVRPVIELQVSECTPVQRCKEPRRCKESGSYAQSRDGYDWIVLGENDGKFLCLSLFGMNTFRFTESTLLNICKGDRFCSSKEEFPVVWESGPVQYQGSSFLLSEKLYKIFQDIIMPLKDGWWLSPEIKSGIFRHLFVTADGNIEKVMSDIESFMFRPVAWFPKEELKIGFGWNIVDCVNGYNLCVADTVLLLRPNNLTLPKGIIWEESEQYEKIVQCVKWFVDRDALVMNLAIPEFKKYVKSIPEVPHAWWVAEYDGKLRRLVTCVVTSEKAVKAGMRPSRMNGFRPAFFIK